MVNLLPLLKGWTYRVITVDKSTYTNQNQIVLANESISGWLTNIEVYMDDQNAEMDVFLDNIKVISMTPQKYYYAGQMQLDSYPTISTFDQYLPGTGTELFGLLLSSSEGYPFTQKINININTAMSSIYIHSAVIKYIAIVDRDAFIDSLKELYESTSTTPVPQPVPPQTKIVEVPEAPGIFRRV